MRTIRLAFAALLLALTAAATPDVALAHAPKQAYMFLRLYGDSTIVRLEYLIPDLERALKLGWAPGVRPTREQVEAALPAIRAYAEPRFGLGAAGTQVTTTFRGFDFRNAENGSFLLLEYHSATPLRGRVSISLTPFFESDPEHRNLVVIEHDWKTGTFNNEFTVSTIHSPAEPTQVLDLSTSTLWRGVAALVKFGVWHIWAGLDHILFLVALILPSVLVRDNDRWRPADRFGGAFIKVVKIVSAFTIAHTITLSLAALDIVRLPSRLVESAIAVSIILAAAHNLRPWARVNEVAIAFGFGLFHGFGFATVLGELGLGTEHLVLSLLGFNAGVELGQLAIITAIFPVLFLIRRSRLYPFVLSGGSLLLIAIGGLWAVERVFAFNIRVIPLAKSLVGTLTGGRFGTR